MTIGTILPILLIQLLAGVLPLWPHGRTWGYAPSAGLGSGLLIIVILVVMGLI